MKHLYLYLHTHWDREWYRPFADFRCDLVGVVRTVCDSLEEGVVPNFYLDGQACVLDDATQISPELAPRITALMHVGRLAAGPWYVLADQMLVSGESLVRNLKLGLSHQKAGCSSGGTPRQTTAYLMPKPERMRGRS